MREQKVNIATTRTVTHTIENRETDALRAGFVMDLVALTTGVAAQDIRLNTRGTAKAARARQVAMYLTYVAWGWKMARVGAAFGRDRTTAGYACKLVEDLRDNVGFDRMLEQLETCLKDAPAPRAVRLLRTDLVEMAA